MTRQLRQQEIRRLRERFKKIEHFLRTASYSPASECQTKATGKNPLNPKRRASPVLSHTGSSRLNVDRLGGCCLFPHPCSN